MELKTHKIEKNIKQSDRKHPHKHTERVSDRKITA